MMLSISISHVLFSNICVYSSQVHITMDVYNKYAAQANTIKIEDITPDKQNQTILQQLKDNLTIQRSIGYLLWTVK